MTVTTKKGHAPPGGKGLPQHMREIPPNAFKTLTAIREMGYDSFASIMDLVDNSIDAKATKIAVQIRGGEKASIFIDILDNGVGMDEATLAQALRLGSDTERKDTDLGKYGMGLVSASLAMARSIYVLTRRSKAQAFEANFDLKAVEEHNKFLIELKPAGGGKVFDTLGDQGTLVRLSSIDRISDRNIGRFAGALRTRMAQTYRHFISRGLKLIVNGRVVAAADPLMREHAQTEVVYDAPVKFGDVTARLTIAELPDLGTAGDQDAGIFPHNSGFYVMRNGRQIMAGETFGLYRHHHSYSHFRAELAFGGDADQMFHVDVKKSLIHPDDKFLDKLKELSAKYIAASGQRGRDRGDEQPVKLKLDGAMELLNRRLEAAVPAGRIERAKVDEPAKPAPAAEKDGKAVEHKAPAAAPAVVEHKPRVRFGEWEGEPAGRFYRATEKEGQWLVEFNTRHPLVRTVGEAKHKAASTLLTYFAFAMAEAEGMKNGTEFVEAVSKQLSEVLAA